MRGFKLGLTNNQGRGGSEFSVHGNEGFSEFTDNSVGNNAGSGQITSQTKNSIEGLTVSKQCVYFFGWTGFDFVERHKPDFFDNLSIETHFGVSALMELSVEAFDRKKQFERVQRGSHELIHEKKAVNPNR